MPDWFLWVTWHKCNLPLGLGSSFHPQIRVSWIAAVANVYADVSMLNYFSFSASMGFSHHLFCIFPFKENMIFKRESAAKQDLKNTEHRYWHKNDIDIYLWSSVTFSVVACSSRQWHPGFCTLALWHVYAIGKVLLSWTFGQVYVEELKLKDPLIDTTEMLLENEKRRLSRLF